MEPTTGEVERVARALAEHDGYDPDEQWQEFDRNAHHSAAAVGETYDDPVITRWQTYTSKALTAICAMRQVAANT